MWELKLVNQNISNMSETELTFLSGYFNSSVVQDNETQHNLST